MFKGHFDLQLMGAGGLSDADFDAATRERRIMDLLVTLPVHEKVGTDNRIFHRMSSYIFNHLFQGGDITDPFDYGGSNAAALAFVSLVSTDGEPPYDGEDWWRYNNYGYDNIQSVPDNVGGNPSKRFEEDQITPWEVWEDTSGRESIHFRNRWLYLPSEANSSTIRSLGIYFASDGDDTYRGYSDGFAKIGRVRLKDSGGNPVTLSKNVNQVLLIEYTFSLVSM